MTEPLTEAGSGPDGPRLALVTNVLSHYRVAGLRCLADHLPGRFTCFLLTAEMEHRRYVFAGGAGDLPVVTLPGRRWQRPPDDDLHWNDVRPVVRGGYDVWILGGWSEPTYLHLWLRHLLRRRVRSRVRLLFWIESTAADRARRPGRELVKRLLLRTAAGCLVPGERAAAYCRGLGVAPARIFTAPNAADRGYFRAEAARLLPRRAELRRELGVGEGVCFLFAGRLVESIKGVESLVRATAALKGRGLSATLVLAGDGPDRSRYAALAAELGVDARFLGTVDHAALCRWYAVADALVLPSRSEVWGFVLNEAMEFGLPLVASDAVGAAPELVHPGENGFIVPVGDVAALAAALAELAGDAARRRAMGRASADLVARFTPERWAAGVLAAVAAVAAQGAEARAQRPGRRGQGAEADTE